MRPRPLGGRDGARGGGMCCNARTFISLLLVHPLQSDPAHAGICAGFCLKKKLEPIGDTSVSRAQVKNIVRHAQIRHAALPAGIAAPGKFEHEPVL